LEHRSRFDRPAPHDAPHRVHGDRTRDVPTRPRSAPIRSARTPARERRRRERPGRAPRGDPGWAEGGTGGCDDSLIWSHSRSRSRSRGPARRIASGDGPLGLDWTGDSATVQGGISP
jgi:hypothetical protein